MNYNRPENMERVTRRWEKDTQTQYIELASSSVYGTVGVPNAYKIYLLFISN